MNDAQPMHRVSYLLFIWSERRPDLPLVWNGLLQAASGQRFYFTTLAELERLLSEIGGWIDPPEKSMDERSSQ